MYSYSPFRKSYKRTDHIAQCSFCDPVQMQKQSVKDETDNVIENESYRWIVNFFPKFEGHTMLVPKRHFVALEEETDTESLARQHLLKEAIPLIQKIFPESGLEYFVQTGTASGSSIPHLHFHLVPARPDDSLRGFEKLGHFYTTNEHEEKVVIFPHRITLSPEDLLGRFASIER